MGKSGWLNRAHLMAAITLMAGCYGSHSLPPNSQVSAKSSAAIAPNNDECLAFSRDFVAAVEGKDASAIIAAVNWNALLETTTASLELSAANREKFIQGVKRGVQSERGLAAELIRQMEAGGSYRFLRTREMDGDRSVLFRLVGPAGVNYHEFLLSKTDSGVKASDVFVYVSGERLSQTIRRAALPLSEQLSKSWVEKLTTSESAYIKNYDLVTQMSDHIRMQKASKALAVYWQMPSELQHDKTVMLMRYQAANAVGNQAVIDAIADFRRQYPDDACLDFVLIDYYSATKEYDQSLVSIGRLDQAVGGDPYLDSLRAMALVRKGDYRKAFELAERAIDGAGDILDPYWNMIVISSQANDFDRVLHWLQQAQVRLGVKFGDLSSNPALAEFMRSPQGQQWTRMNSAFSNHNLQ